MPLPGYDFPGASCFCFRSSPPKAVPKFALFVSIAVTFLRLDLIGTFWGVVVVQMLGAVLVMIWIPTAAFRGIPPALKEAGFDLGASRLRVFLLITLPQAMAALVASYVLACVGILFKVDRALLTGAPQIATMPLVLMDEPFSALNAHLRKSLREELKLLQRRPLLTTIFVTHDQEDMRSTCLSRRATA